MSKSNTAKKSETVETPKVDVKPIDVTKYAGLSTKSAKIRSMFADGYTRSQIAKALDIRYQHVRNVLVEPLKRTAA